MSKFGKQNKILAIYSVKNRINAKKQGEINVYIL